MDNHEFIQSLHTLPVSDSNPQPPNLERRSTFNGSLPYKSLSTPSVLNTESIIPVDDTSQRRLDQIPVKVNSDELVFMPDFRTLLTADSYPLSPDLIEQSNLSPPFAYKLIPDPPVLESSMAPSTGSELMQPEETGADIDRLTPLEKAELMLQLAKKRKAPLKEINQLKNKVSKEKIKIRKSIQLKKLETKLTAEQISQIKKQSLKYASSISQKYNFVMIHLTKHADKRLTKNHTLKDLCDAIVYGDKIGLDSAEYKLFCPYKKRVDSTYSSRKCRKFHAEYIKRLRMAIEMTE